MCEYEVFRFYKITIVYVRSPAFWRLTSSIHGFRLQVSRNFLLPAVTVRQKLLLIVQKFFVRERGVLKVWTLNDGIHRARFLAKAAEDALGHIYVVSSRSSATILSLLSLNRDSLRRADGFTQLTRDTSLFTRRVSSQRVFPAESRRQRSLLERVVDRHLFVKEVLQRQRHSPQKLRQRERLRRRIQHTRQIRRHRLLSQLSRPIKPRRLSIPGHPHRRALRLLNPFVRV